MEPAPAPGADRSVASLDAPLALALIVGFAGVIALLWRRRGEVKVVDNASPERASAAATGGVPVNATHMPKDAMPSDGVFTLKSLGKFDGRRLPMCLSVCGKVVDVSSSENFEPDSGYGSLWAGRDATYSLATLSLKKEDSNKLDFSLEDFSAEQRTALAGWYKHFTSKYPVVGTLKEYDGRDFSSVEKESVTQTPFASKNNDYRPDEAEPKATPATTSVAPEAGLVLRKGERVQIKGCKDFPDYNGKEGILEGYIGEKQRFEVKLDSGASVYLKPDELAKPSS